MTEPSAVQAEATGDETVEVTWEGLALRVPSSIEAWDPDALEELEHGHFIRGLKGVLGDAGYLAAAAEFKRLHGRKWTVGDLIALNKRIMVPYGFNDSGE